MIVITGESAQGKTPIAFTLQKEFGLYIIHTDLFSFAVENSRLGESYEEKIEWIKSHKAELTDTFILEGIHASCQAELDLYIKLLRVKETHIFRLKNPNHKAQFDFKHRKSSPEEKATYFEWFNETYDLEATEFKTYMELEDILIKRGLVSVPTNDKNGEESQEPEL